MDSLPFPRPPRSVRLPSVPSFISSFLLFPRRSPSHFISLSLRFLRSLCLLRVSNKQTSSGWLASPIYNSSQSNYSEDVCQTHEAHLCIAEGEKKYVSPSWLGLNTHSIPAFSWEVQLVFMAFRLFFDRKHTREGQGCLSGENIMWSNLWAQVKSTLLWGWNALKP